MKNAAPLPGIGSEEHFNQILSELNKNTRNYEDKKIKHNQWVEASENIFSQFGWSKVEFYKELNSRIGVQTNETRKKKNASPSKSKLKNNKIINNK